MDLSRSQAWYERARVVLPGGNSRSTIDLKPHPIYVTHGKDSRVFDVDGNPYVDFNNNYTSLILGHANDAVNAAVAAQVPHGTAFSFGTREEVEHAELLISRVPTFDQIRFMNSGSEAVMNALKAARAYTGRPKIAKCRCLPRQLRLCRSQPERWAGQLGRQLSKGGAIRQGYAARCFG